GAPSLRAGEHEEPQPDGDEQHQRERHTPVAAERVQDVDELHCGPRWVSHGHGQGPPGPGSPNLACLQAGVVADTLPGAGGRVVDGIAPCSSPGRSDPEPPIPGALTGNGPQELALSALQSTRAAPPAVAAGPAAAFRSRSAAVRGSSSSPPGRVLGGDTGGRGPPGPGREVGGPGGVPGLPGVVDGGPPGGFGLSGGCGGGLVSARASAGSTVMIMGTANAPVPTTAALRRKSRRSRRAPRDREASLAPAPSVMSPEPPSGRLAGDSTTVVGMWPRTADRDARGM